MLNPPLQTTWQTRPIQCILCQEDQAETLWYKDGFRYVQCRSCHLVYVNPQLLPADIEQIYSIGYASKSQSKPEPIDDRAYRSVLDWAEPYRQIGKFLDIGCFKGHLLTAAHKRGWSVYGTEISRQAVAYARQKAQLSVFLGSLEAAAYPTRSFDAIVMLDVIEHLSDPLEYLREIRRILRPGGGLYLDTPNYSSLTRRFYGKEWANFFPWHQYYFTPQTLSRLLQTAGLQVQHLEAIGVSPLSRYNAYQSLITQQSIANSSRRHLKSLARRYVPELRHLLLNLQGLGNLPFRVCSTRKLYLGSKLIATATPSNDN